MANFYQGLIYLQSLKGLAQSNIDLIHFLFDCHLTQIDFSLSIYPAFVFHFVSHNFLKKIIAYPQYLKSMNLFLNFDGFLNFWFIYSCALL